MLGPLTFLDAILLGIALISGMLAMYRGLTREVLSILSWALAAGAAVVFGLFYRHIANDLAISLGIDKTIALALCLILLFLVILIVVHFITSKFSDTVLDSRVGALDRTLGFIFGLGRGFILVVILYFFGAFLEPKVENHPKWVTESLSLPYIVDTGNFITNVMKKVMPDKIKIPDLNSDTEQQSSVSNNKNKFA
ncbi:MAG: CvpA family protein [Rhodomicrobiaceae bacterium]|jgi:membrane protein required for colicin V production